MQNALTPLALAISATLAWGVVASNVQAAELRTAQTPVEGQYIVVLKEPMARLASQPGNGPTVATVADDMAVTYRAQLVRSYEHVLRGFVVKADDAQLARMLADPRVEYIEEDGVVSITGSQTNATWGLDRVDQRNLPLDRTYNWTLDGTGTHAYIIDTGILTTHTEFTGRTGTGYTAINDGRGTTDCNGHGTHVAGTVAGTTYGVAKKAKVYPVRVLSCSGSGSNSGVIAGMDWVTANHVKPAVANMSLGGGASSTTDSAVQRMVSAGVTVVVAAGNSNDNACNYSPARAPNAITVGSTANNDSRSSFSSYGTCLDIWAPGSSITSAWHTGTSATNTISGTSMASPHVAGVAALYLGANPTATPAQVTTALNNNATPNKVTNPGSGSPNRLLYSIFDGVVDNKPPVADFRFSASGLTVSFTDASSDPDGTVASRLWTFHDNTTSTETNPSKTYAAAGTYKVTLTVTDNKGATNTKTQDVTVTGGGGGDLLKPGEPRTGLAAAAGQDVTFRMEVPAGARNLVFTTSGGTGDADLYVRAGSAPTDSSYDCRPYTGGNNETCSFATPTAGTYYVRVKAYNAFSGLTLVGNYNAGGDTQTYTNNTATPVPDQNTVESTINVSGRSGNAPRDAGVFVNITHSYRGDLKVDLVAPDGTAYPLHNRQGGSADDINQSYVVDLSSEPLNGAWKLRVQDAARGDTGTLNRWSITF